MKLTKLTFIIACYRSEKTIRHVVNEIRDNVRQKSEYDYEIILINDASPDNVLSEIKKMAFEDEKIKALDLAMNVGKASAVMAGLSKMTGDLIVFLDDDGQCPVDHLFDLVKAVESGHDIAIAHYPKKKQAWWKNIGSKVNQRLMKFLVGQPKEVEFSNFSVRKRFLCEEMLRYKNPYPNLQGLVLRVTHNIIMIPMEERERIEGKSGYTFWKSFKLLINGCTGFSVIPLRIASVLGMLFSIIGLLMSVITAMRKFINPHILPGYSSTIALLLLIGGIIMLLLGIIGEYLGRIYICINNAPQYVIRDEWNT